MPPTASSSAARGGILRGAPLEELLGRQPPQLAAAAGARYAPHRGSGVGRASPRHFGDYVCAKGAALLRYRSAQSIRHRCLPSVLSNHPSGLVHVAALVLDEQALATHWGCVHNGRFVYLMSSYDAALMVWSNEAFFRVCASSTSRSATSRISSRSATRTRPCTGGSTPVSAGLGLLAQGNSGREALVGRKRSEPTGG